MEDELTKTNVADWTITGGTELGESFPNGFMPSLVGDPLTVPSEVSVHGLMENISRGLEKYGECWIQCSGSSDTFKANKAVFLASKRIGWGVITKIELMKINDKIVIMLKVFKS